jgi:hypothetical protein
MSLVLKNIDPPPLSPTGECVPPPLLGWGGGGGGENTLAARRVLGGGSIFWKKRDTGLPSYSNNLSTVNNFKKLAKIKCEQVMDS